MRMRWCVLWASAIVAGWGGPAGVALAQAPPRDPADLAADVSANLKAAILTKFASQTPRVAVLPTANKNGDITALTAEGAVALQGELIIRLRTLSAGAYTVLSPPQLGKAFKSKGIDPGGIDATDPNTTGQTLVDLDLDVAIQAVFDKEHGGDVSTQLKVSFVVLFRDKTSTKVDKTCPGTVVPPPVVIEPGGPENPARGRFLVEVLVKGSPLPMKRVDEPGDGLRRDAAGRVALDGAGLPEVADASQAEQHQLHNVYVLEIPQSFVANQQSFAIRLTNKGAPFVRWQAPPNRDRDRLYAVSLMADGVSTILAPTGQVDAAGQPTYDFQQACGKNLAKWVLSGPGKRAVADASRPAPAAAGAGVFYPKLVGPDAQGKDGSVVEVPGFQKGPDVAAQFLFGAAKDSAAVLMGVTNNIGIIRAEFYAEDFGSPDDVQIGLANPDSGIVPGKDVPNKVFPIFFDKHKDPVEVWHIFYRVAGAPPLPGTPHLVPFVP